MKFTFIGTGNAFAQLGRFQPAHWMTVNNSHILWDCGNTALAAIKKFNLPITQLQTIFISHFHGDHILGLPFIFLDRIYLNPVDTKIQVYGFKGIKKVIDSLMTSIYPAQANQVDQVADIHELSTDTTIILPMGIVKTTKSNHTDNSLFFKFIPNNHTTKDLPVVAYTGDNELTQEQLPFLKDVDVLITECTDWDQTGGNHTSWSLLKTFLSDLRSLGVKKIILVHLGERVINASSQEFPTDVIRTYDGLELDFKQLLS